MDFPLKQRARIQALMLIKTAVDSRIKQEKPAKTPCPRRKFRAGNIKIRRGVWFHRVPKKDVRAKEVGFRGGLRRRHGASVHIARFWQAEFSGRLPFCNLCRWWDENPKI
jgi:hypothetical protein